MSDPGDPNGRRLSRRRSLLLAEAGRLGHALKALLRRADFGTSAIDALSAAIQREELRHLQQAEGKIESRKRFGKHASQPNLDGRQCHEMFLDESGKSSIEPVDGPTFFALAGVAMSPETAAVYCAAADNIKMEFFNTTDITFPRVRHARLRRSILFLGEQTEAA